MSHRRTKARRSVGMICEQGQNHMQNKSHVVDTNGLGSRYNIMTESAQLPSDHDVIAK